MRHDEKGHILSEIKTNFSKFIPALQSKAVEFVNLKMTLTISAAKGAKTSAGAWKGGNGKLSPEAGYSEEEQRMIAFNENFETYNADN